VTPGVAAVGGGAAGTGVGGVTPWTIDIAISAAERIMISPLQ
jgi:hypothetical protein